MTRRWSLSTLLLLSLLVLSSLLSVLLLFLLTNLNAVSVDLVHDTAFEPEQLLHGQSVRLGDYRHDIHFVVKLLISIKIVIGSTISIETVIGSTIPYNPY